jgi:trypsin
MKNLMLWIPQTALLDNNLAIITMRLPILLAIAALLPVSHATFHHLRPVKNEMLGDSMMFGQPSSESKNANRVLVDNYATPRIAGGTITEEGQYPYFTTLASRMCGSTLIHPDILMTAGNCQKAYAKERVVYVGAHEVNGTRVVTAAETRRVVRQYPHPDFDFSWRHNDLTLFQLDRPVNPTWPVQLNSDPDIPSLNSTLTAIGFGASHWLEPCSDFLLESNLYPGDPDTCKSQYRGYGFYDMNPAIILCASHPLPDHDSCIPVPGHYHDSCHGDSGGPLLDTATGTQVGIVSFVFGCWGPNFPGIYTRVSAYTNWIHDRICELSAVPPADCNTTQTDPAADWVKVLVYIRYDDHPEQVFWRLEEKSTGQTIAFQPSLPDVNATFYHRLSLQPGKYTLQVYTDGDGMQGQIIVSAHGNPLNDSTLESRSQVLAQSDGNFTYQLALDFTVPPLDGGPWSDGWDTGDDDSSSKTWIWVGTAIVVVMIISALLVLVVLMRPLPCCGKWILVQTLRNMNT